MQLKRPVNYKQKLNPQRILHTLCLSLILIFNCAIFAQVKIKERVEIKPDNTIIRNYDRLLDDTTRQKTSADLRIEMTSSSGSYSYFLFQSGQYRVDMGSTSGNISFTIPNIPGGGYSVHYGFLTEDKQQLATDCYVLKKYFNNYLIDSISDI